MASAIICRPCHRLASLNTANQIPQDVIHPCRSQKAPAQRCTISLAVRDTLALCLAPHHPGSVNAPLEFCLPGSATTDLGWLASQAVGGVYAWQRGVCVVYGGKED